MKPILYFILLFVFFNAFSQKEYAKIYLTSGETITAYDGSAVDEPHLKIRKKGRSMSTKSNIGLVTLDGDVLLYFDEQSEIKKVKGDDIKTVKIDTKTFNELSLTIVKTKITEYFATVNVESEEIILLNMPISKNKKRLHQLIAENDKYILTNLMSNGLNYFYVYDKDHNIIEKQILHSTTQKKGQNAIEEVKKYFSDCTELISKMEENNENKFIRGYMSQYFLLMTVDEDQNGSNFITNFSCK